MNRWIGAWIVVLLLAGSARAEDGVAPLEAGERRALVENVDRARAGRPRAFARVAAVRARLLEHGGAPHLSVTPQLRALGSTALWPMLGEIGLADAAGGELSPRARLTWRVGLLEAIGMLRDARARPVLVAILERRPAEYEIDRAAAEALARLGDDAAASTLLALLGGPKQTAVLAGLGNCRRAVVAAELAVRLDARPEAAQALRLVRALRDVGNAWAWQTPSVQASGEEASVRPVAARALVDAFVAYDGEVRWAAGRALLVVADPGTPGLIQASKPRADAATTRDLERLEQRLARSRVH
jgi:hypothetical protein